jgi:hypothetical protein
MTSDAAACCVALRPRYAACRQAFEQNRWLALPLVSPLHRSQRMLWSFLWVMLMAAPLFEPA